MIFFIQQPSIFCFCLIQHEISAGHFILIKNTYVGNEILEANFLEFSSFEKFDPALIFLLQEIGNKTPLVKVKTENPPYIFCDRFFFNDVTTVEANLSRILTHFFALFLFRGCSILFSFLLIVWRLEGHFEQETWSGLPTLPKNSNIWKLKFFLLWSN